MEDWGRKMRRSGYSAPIRHKVVKEAVLKYEKMCEVEDSGGRPVHRAREWQQSTQRLEKEMKGATWHKGEKDEISAPLIIDPLAGNLTNGLKDVCAKFQAASGLRVTVRERAGVSLKHDAKAEPLRNNSCGRHDCLCCSKGKPGKCEQNSVGYRIKCESCQGAGKFVHYEGETGRSTYSRGLEHQKDIRYKDEESPLWKHCLLEHNGVAQSFVMKALGSFKSCLQRQVNEAVRITSSKVEVFIMNSKNKFHQAPIIRVVTSKGLHGDQGEDQAPVLAGGPWRGAAGRGGREGGERRGAGRGGAGRRSGKVPGD